MKKFTILNLLLAVTLILGACSTSNNVVNNRLISKRKYNKGFHFNKKGNYKSDKGELASEDLKNENADPQAYSSNDSRTTIRSQEETSPIDEMAVVDSKEITKELKVDTREVESNGFVKTDISPSNAEVEVEESSTESKNIISKTDRKETKKLVRKAAKNSKKRGGSSSDLMFILAVIFAILLPPLGVAIYTNIDWMKVLIALLLMILFVLPGIIYALLVVFDVI